MIGGDEARSLVEKAALYDKATAEQWLRRQIKAGCFLAVQGAHNIWLEGAKTDTRPVTSVEIDAGIGLDELSVAKEAFLIQARRRIQHYGIWSIRSPVRILKVIQF